MKMKKNDREFSNSFLIQFLLYYYQIVQTRIVAYSKGQPLRPNFEKRRHLQNVQANHLNISDPQNVHLQIVHNTIQDMRYATILTRFFLVVIF